MEVYGCDAWPDESWDTTGVFLFVAKLLLLLPMLLSLFLFRDGSGIDIQNSEAIMI